jgi:hypothetical protein
MRRGTSATALIEQNNAVTSGVKKLPMPSFTARAGAAVQKHNRHAVWIAAFFNVKGVYLVHGEEKMPVFVDGGIKWQHVNLLWTN